MLELNFLKQRSSSLCQCLPTGISIRGPLASPLLGRDRHYADHDRRSYSKPQLKQECHNLHLRNVRVHRRITSPCWTGLDNNVEQFLLSHLDDFSQAVWVPHQVLCASYGLPQYQGHFHSHTEEDGLAKIGNSHPKGSWWHLCGYEKIWQSPSWACRCMAANGTNS